MAIGRLVLGVEAVIDDLDPGRIDGTDWSWHRELVGLTAVSDVDGTNHTYSISAEALDCEFVSATLLETFDHLSEVAEVRPIGGLDARLHMIIAHVGHEDTQRASDPRARRDQHGWYREFAGEPAG